MKITKSEVEDKFHVEGYDRLARSVPPYFN
jgi:hypothetical protein